MRLWLDPQKMAVLGLSADDVMKAVQEQNIQVAAGSTGQPPMPRGQEIQLTINTLGRLADVKEFETIVVKADGGRLTYLKDVARVELGALGYDQTCTMDGKPSVALSIYQLPGTNAIDTSRLIKEKMEELCKRFPSGIDYEIVYNTTPFIRE